MVAKLAGFWQVASAISLLLIAGLLAWEKFDSTGADRSASRKDTYDPAAFPETAIWLSRCLPPVRTHSNDNSF